MLGAEEKKVRGLEFTNLIVLWRMRTHVYGCALCFLLGSDQDKHRCTQELHRSCFGWWMCYRAVDAAQMEAAKVLSAHVMKNPNYNRRIRRHQYPLLLENSLSCLFTFLAGFVQGEFLV